MNQEKKTDTFNSKSARYRMIMHPRCNAYRRHGKGDEGEGRGYEKVQGVGLLGGSDS